MQWSHVLQLIRGISTDKETDILRFLRALRKRLVLVAAMVLAIVLPRDGLSLVLHDENCYLFYAANFQLNLFTTTNTPLYLSEMYKMHPN